MNYIYTATGDILMIKQKNNIIEYADDEGLNLKKNELSNSFQNIINITDQIYKDKTLSIPNLETTTFNLLPRGIIVAWNPPDPKNPKPPTGWALCDGKIYNGYKTPDLRGRFIRMYSNELYDTGQGKDLGWNARTFEMNIKNEGGKKISGNSSQDTSSIILNHYIGDYAGTDHHYLDIKHLPNHTHKIDSDYKLVGPSTSQNNATMGTSRGTYTGNEDAKQIKDLNTTSVGEGNGHNNQPPYYVLAYIIKI